MRVSRESKMYNILMKMSSIYEYLMMKAEEDYMRMLLFIEFMERVNKEYGDRIDKLNYNDVAYITEEMCDTYEEIDYISSNWISLKAVLSEYNKIIKEYMQE